MLNKTLAITIAATATPPSLKMAETIATEKNSNARHSMMQIPFIYKSKRARQ